MKAKSKLRKPSWGRTFIFKKLYEDAVRSGVIDPENKNEEEIKKEFESLYQSLAKQNVEFIFILDHTPDLLRQARYFANEGKYQFSCLFYATWLEHWVNAQISSLGRRKGLSEEEIIQIIREVQFKGKITWLLKVFGLRPIYPAHRNAILKIAELRNGFIHYKFKGRPADEDESQEEKEVEKYVKAIEKTVSYLKAYERKSIFKQKKRAVRRVSREIATEVENRD